VEKPTGFIGGIDQAIENDFAGKVFRLWDSATG
jgi:hypothetical protein